MKHARRYLDSYFTREPWIVDLGADHVPLPPGIVWESACGAGHLCRGLTARGRTVFASDIFDWGWPCVVRDFFAFKAAPPGVTSIFTNPPFRRGVAERFVRHALDLMAPVGGTVAMLLNHDWMTAGPPRGELFSIDSPFERVIVPTRRPLWFDPAEMPADAPKPNSRNPEKNYDWYVWSPAGIGRAATVHVVPA